MTRSVANTYVAITTDNQTLTFIARNATEVKEKARKMLWRMGVISVRRVFKSGKLGKELLGVLDYRRGNDWYNFSNR